MLINDGRNQMLVWEIPYEVSTCLVTVSVLHYLFKDVCIASVCIVECLLPGQREDIFLTRRVKATSPCVAKIEQVCLQPFHKTRDFLNSVFLSCDANPLYVQHPHWHHPYGAWWTRDIEVNMTLILPATPRVTKSLVSSSWAMCLLLAYIKLWQTSLFRSRVKSQILHSSWHQGTGKLVGEALWCYWGNWDFPPDNEAKSARLLI